MNELDSLDSRISKLQTSVDIRFAVEIVVIPILIVVATFFLDYRLDRAKEEFQGVQLTQVIIPKLFTGDPYEVFAHERLLSTALDANHNSKLRTEKRSLW